MTDAHDRLAEAKSIVDGERDELLRVLLDLHARGQIQITPQSEDVSWRPVVVLPRLLYDRFRVIAFEAARKDEGQDGVS